MNLRWFLTLLSLVASLRNSLNSGKAGSGTILYSSRVFLFVPLGVWEDAAEAMLGLLTTVVTLAKLALAAGPSVTEVLLVDDEILHFANFVARMASSVIVFMPLGWGAQVPKGLKQYKINATQHYGK